MDRIGAVDTVEVGLAEATPPVYPCERCGKETKESGRLGWRNCSAATCRHQTFRVTPEQLAGLTHERDELKERVGFLDRTLKQARQESLAFQTSLKNVNSEEYARMAEEIKKLRS